MKEKEVRRPFFARLSFTSTPPPPGKSTAAGEEGQGGST